MYKNKFNIGDVVRVTAGKYAGNELKVTSIFEEEEDTMFSESGKYNMMPKFSYYYRFKSPDDQSFISINENYLVKITNPEIELFNETSKNDKKPDPTFNIGDIVKVLGGNQYYIVKESIDIKTYPEFIYEISPLNDDSKTFQYKESSLEFEDHDISVEYYLKHREG